MRLLLDEQFTPEIASNLRERGHDVGTVGERPDLVSADDETLLSVCASERSALLTNNVRDFMVIARRWTGEGRSHYGLVLVSDRTFPRSRTTIGPYVRVLERLLAAHAPEDALRDQAIWLTEPKD